MQMAKEAPETPSSCAQCLATKVRDSPLGLLCTGTLRDSSTRAPPKGTGEGGGGGGRGGQGCIQGSPPSHRATTWQCRHHNAPGQEKQQRPPVPTARTGPGQPQDIPEEVLEETAASLDRAEGTNGSGWTRLLQLLCCKAHLMCGNPFQLDSRGKTKEMTS